MLRSIMYGYAVAITVALTLFAAMTNGIPGDKKKHGSGDGGAGAGGQQGGSNTNGSSSAHGDFNAGPYSSCGESLDAATLVGTGQKPADVPWLTDVSTERFNKALKSDCPADSTH